MKLRFFQFLCTNLIVIQISEKKSQFICKVVKKYLILPCGIAK